MEGTASGLTRPVRPAQSASVQGSETNAQRYDPDWTWDMPAQTRWQELLHERSAAARTRLLYALAVAPDAQLNARARKMAACCAHPMICLRSDGAVVIAPGHCRNRMCPRCATLRGLTLSRKVYAIVRAFNAPRFLTLTRRHDQATLGEALTDLYGSFRRLRRSQAWKRHVESAVTTCEVTRNTKTSTWHVHLHIILDGTFWPHEELRDAWKTASNGSTIVYVRAVHDRERDAKYVATYIAKPPNVLNWPVETIAEYAQGIHGRRLVITTGKLHGTEDLNAEETTPPRLVEPLCSLDRLHSARALGSPQAAEALALLARVDARMALAHDTLRSGLQRDGEPLTEHDATRLAELCRAIGERTGPLDERPPPDTEENKRRRRTERQQLLPCTPVSIYPT
jgi:replication protein